MQVLKGGALPRLMEMTHSNSSAEAVKALYAVSAIVRNFPLGQEAFYLEGGPLLLQVFLVFLSMPLWDDCGVIVPGESRVRASVDSFILGVNN
jgi:hypothetical protein